MEMSVDFHAPASLPQGKNAGTHGLGGYVGPKGDLEILEKEKLSSLQRDSKPGPFISQHNPYTYLGMLFNE